jgi:hypothetical protein
MAMQDDGYSCLWSNDGRHVLVDLRGARDIADLVIFQADGSRMVLLDDDALAESVIKRMIESGVPVRDEMPYS